MFSHLPKEIEDLIVSFGNLRKYRNLYIGTFSDEDERYFLLHDLLEKKIENYEYNFIWHNYNSNLIMYHSGCIVPCNLVTGKYLHIQKYMLNDDYRSSSQLFNDVENDSILVHDNSQYKSKFNIVRCFFSKYSYVQDSSDLEDEGSVYEMLL